MCRCPFTKSLKGLELTYACCREILIASLKHLSNYQVTKCNTFSVLFTVNIVSPLLLLGHLSHSGDLLSWVGVRRRASSVNIFFSKTTGPILTKFGM